MRGIWFASIAGAMLAVVLFSAVALGQATPTRTPVILPTPTLSVITATALRDANLRAGPGTTFAIVGGVKAGQALEIVSENPAGDWYQLKGGQWIAAFLVSNLSEEISADQPVVQAGQAATVTRIIDGDTIDVSINGKLYKVRYILVNTPETGQPLYAEATEANRKLVAGKRVYLVKDVSETDRFGRLLRYVYLADGTFVNAELVRQGYAQLATFPPDVARETEIRTAQREAVAAGHGLWAGASTTTTTAPVAATTAPQSTQAPTVVPTNTPAPTIVPTTAPAPTVAPTATPQSKSCDPSYPDVCIPPYPPDLDCKDIPQYASFKVLTPDPHGFDGNDNDGLGCESN